MRCLYCGKELALLKRWTGGGEFCSDAHRQRYQEEYNQLALNRLLQAKPPSEPQQDTPVKSAEPVHKTPAPPEPVRIQERIPPPAVARLEAPQPAPVAQLAAAVADQEPAPAEMAGFLVELPVPVLAEVAPMSSPEIQFFLAVAASLPNHAFEPSNGKVTFQLETAGPLTLQHSNRASNYSANGSRERRLEVREFVRTAPIVEIDLSPAGETGLETSSEAMDILIFPQPPHGSPALWQEPPVGFAAGGTELGHLARLSFSTTGFSGETEPDHSESSSAVALEEPPAIEVPSEPEPESAEVLQPEPDPIPEPLPEISPEPVMAAPEPEAAPEPLVEALVEPTVEPFVEPVVEQVPEPVPSIPDPVTKPLPLVLQVATPGKAKTVQVFSSASSSVAVHVPRSTSLPLRPVMTFGPAPVKEPEKVADRPAVKSEPKKTSVAPASIKPVKQAAPPQVASVKPAAKPAANPNPNPSPNPNPNMDLKPGNKKLEMKPSEPLMPAPLAAPFPGSGDLGLPRLNLQSSQGFWGGLPIFAKIAIVVVMLSGIGGLIAYSSKSGGAAVSGNGGVGTLVTGPALPAGDAGWITDWGADPGVRRTRQISILRSSQTFTDYRIEMQGQIETKAIGWVFRAANAKNFYVAKLEIVKPGLEPSVALVRFGVINGEEQVHAQIPLPMKVRRDTMYKIRFDAVGDHFTTYVQDVKVDEWTDAQLRTGGVGLYSERGEVATLKGGMSVLPLVTKR